MKYVLPAAFVTSFLLAIAFALLLLGAQSEARARVLQAAVTDKVTVIAAIAVTHCGDIAGVMTVTRDGVVHNVSDMPRETVRAMTKGLSSDSRVEAEAAGDCTPKTIL